MSQRYVLVVGAVDQIKGKHPNTGRVALKIRGDINSRLLECGWPNGAPFTIVSLILRFGVESTDSIEFQPIYEKLGQMVLPIAIQLSMSEIVAAQHSAEQIERVLRTPIVRAVNAVAEKYGLPPAHA